MTWVLGHPTGHVTHRKQSCHIHNRVTHYIRICHITYLNEACRTYEWDLSHVWRSHATHANKLCHICSISELLADIESRELAALVYQGDLSQQVTYLLHDSFICVTWLIHMCYVARSYEWHDSFVCVTWLIHMCNMTYLYLLHDSFVCVTWLIHIYGMARVCTLVALVYQGDLSQQVTYLLYASFNTCNMTHSYMWHDSFRMCDMTY